MAIISFAATSEALLAGAKTRTIRQWNHGYAKRFRGVKEIQAYDRSPRYGGKQIATLDLIIVRLCERNKDGEWPHALSYERARDAEGLAWMEERGLLCGKIEPRVYYENILRMSSWVYVIDFTLSSVEQG